MSSFFNKSSNNSQNFPLKEKTNSFFNSNKENSFFNKSKKSSRNAFDNTDNKKPKSGQKNSFFGGNSGNKKASNWFANTSINPGQENQKDAQ